MSQVVSVLAAQCHKLWEPDVPSCGNPKRGEAIIFRQGGSSFFVVWLVCWKELSRTNKTYVAPSALWFLVLELFG